ncbi:hypothetical protein MMC13_006423 [Lambiella insularis]|nr:hypothetical protein [Lambiella insularis]
MALSEANHDLQNEGLSELSKALNESSIDDGTGGRGFSPRRLTDVLQNSWRFDERDWTSAEVELEKQNWTVSSLTNAFLTARIKGLLRPLNLGSNRSVKTLVETATNRLLDEFGISEDLSSDLNTTIDSLPHHMLRPLLKSNRLPYPLLRTLLSRSKDDSGSLSSLQDVDEAILQNTGYIKSRCQEGYFDTEYFVSMEQLVTILQGTIKDGTVEFRRKTPPKGGFEFLDARRKPLMKIVATDAEFGATFDRLTGGVLRGLDWNNVIVAGGMALQTMLSTDSVRDHERDVLSSDINMYIYGLSPQEANKKVEHIYDVWSNNLPKHRPKARVIEQRSRHPNHKLVVKNGRTISFLAGYPDRRIEILLRMYSSSIQVFQDFDLDICTIGYNGKQVIMMPRFARAIETGYNIFSMNLVLGNRHSFNRRSPESRITKYADRGFGVRILPAYLKVLEVGLSTKDVPQAPRNQPLSEEHGKPVGAEAGLKTLKRIVQIGRDHVACSIDQTIATHQTLAARNAPDAGRCPWKREGRSWLPERERPWLTVEQHLWPADADDHAFEKPETHHDIGSFEVFMRHCEIWHLNAVGAVFTWLRSNHIDEPFEYMDEYQHVRSGNDFAEVLTPLAVWNHRNSTYTWQDKFSTTWQARLLRRVQRSAFRYCFLRLLNEKLEVITAWPAWKGYFTQKIRRQTWGPDLNSAMKNNITIPLLIPHDVEQHIRHLLEVEAGLPPQFNPEELLSPVYNPAYHGHANPSSNLPPLQGLQPPFQEIVDEQGALRPLEDVVTEQGNLRFWTIDNTSMWLGQNRTLDEVFEVLWYFHSFYLGIGEDIAGDLPETIDPNDHHPSADTPRDCAHPKAVRMLARLFRRHTVFLPQGLSDHIVTPDGSLSDTEATLFRAWVFAPPKSPRAQTQASPPADDLFWTDGDEGQWAGPTVPQWEEPSAQSLPPEPVPLRLPFDWSASPYAWGSEASSFFAAGHEIPAQDYADWVDEQPDRTWPASDEDDLYGAVGWDRGDDEVGFFHVE